MPEKLANAFGPRRFESAETLAETSWARTEFGSQKQRLIPLCHTGHWLKFHPASCPACRLRKNPLTELPRS